MVAKLRALVALLAVAVLITGCDPVADPNPQPDHRPAPKDRTLTLIWFSDQPYKARWNIEGGKGLNPTGEEGSAGGERKQSLVVGPTPLIITITVVMSTKTATGWVKIMEGAKELRYEPADRGTRQGTVTYHYEP